jgi:hypothetical protein
MFLSGWVKEQSIGTTYTPILRKGWTPDHLWLVEMNTPKADHQQSYPRIFIEGRVHLAVDVCLRILRKIPPRR